MGYLSALVAAAQKVGSVDPEKVNNAIQSGLKFSAPANDGMMISRPDFGNDRTVDSICSVNYVQMGKGGQTKLIETHPADQELELFRQAYPAK